MAFNYSKYDSETACGRMENYCSGWETCTASHIASYGLCKVADKLMHEEQEPRISLVAVFGWVPQAKPWNSRHRNRGTKSWGMGRKYSQDLDVSKVDDV